MKAGPRVLVSACLLGQPVRYDGRACTCPDPRLERWAREGLLVPVCPEEAGGLGTPRPPAELRGGDGGAALAGVATVVDRNGEDRTEAFLGGARAALATAARLGLRLALLKEGSPSCGPSRLHDGTFQGRLAPGQGVTAALLRAHGLEVFSEGDLDCLEARLAREG